MKLPFDLRAGYLVNLKGQAGCLGRAPVEQAARPRHDPTI